MRCAITGAAGYVGSAICTALRARGCDLLALGRRPPSHPAEFLRFELPGEPERISWQGVDAIVHCAHDFRPTRPADIEQVNVEGGIRLLRAAKSGGVDRGVFISSMSCFEGCRSLYGKAKLRIEAEALRLGYAVVRPGLVYGDKPGGMMGALERAAAASPVVPMLGAGGQLQYLVHIDDLGRLVAGLCLRESPPPAVPLTAAHPEGITLRDIVTELARRKGRSPVYLPIPWQLILAGLKTLEWLRLPTPFRSDSLLGIVHQNPAPDFNLPPDQNALRRFR